MSFLGEFYKISVECGDQVEVEEGEKKQNYFPPFTLKVEYLLQTFQ